MGKGDKLKVGKQFFCKTKAPEVESTKPIKLMFLSDKKDSSGVATCSVMCADSATTTPPPSPTTAGISIGDHIFLFSNGSLQRSDVGGVLGIYQYESEHDYYVQYNS